MTMIEEDVRLGALLLNYPKKMLPLFDRAIGEVQEEMIAEVPDAAQTLVKKDKYHARITNLPLQKEFRKG